MFLFLTQHSAVFCIIVVLSFCRWRRLTTITTWRSSLFSRNFGFRLASSYFNIVAVVCVCFFSSPAKLEKRELEKTLRLQLQQDIEVVSVVRRCFLKIRLGYHLTTSRLSLDNVWQSCDVLGIFRFLANDVIIVNLWRFDVTSWQRLGYHLTTYRLSL